MTLITPLDMARLFLSEAKKVVKPEGVNPSIRDWMFYMEQWAEAVQRQLDQS